MWVRVLEVTLLALGAATLFVVGSVVLCLLIFSVTPAGHAGD